MGQSRADPRKAYSLQEFVDALVSFLSLNAVQGKGKGDILKDRQVGKQVAVLEHKASMSPLKKAEGFYWKRAYIDAKTDHSALLRSFKTADAIEKRGLA